MEPLLLPDNLPQLQEAIPVCVKHPEQQVQLSWSHLHRKCTDLIHVETPATACMAAEVCCAASHNTDALQAVYQDHHHASPPGR